ncbi:MULTISPECIES: YajG family lipoprotein [Shewanella]|uniref:YajG family lipoprotein n=1 Tax=Shewanella TaxID=22 RepID=UPI00049102ED|nr:MULTISPECIES: YajG family lipoprotein [Shewanella]QLE86428.1 hypothetical protein FLM48_15905 [Shewanella sp. Scap07]
MKLRLFPLFAIAILAGCASSQPTHIALSPQAPNVEVQTQSSQRLAIETIDTRKANFVVRMHKGDDAAKLVSPSETPRKQIDSLFRDGFRQAGYVIDPSATEHVQIQLEKLLADVNENTFGYEANTEVVINVIANNSRNRTLTKRYTAKNNHSGPFSPDFAKMELAINQLIADLSRDILQDPELNQFIQP